MADNFNSKLCDERHQEDERRIAKLEASLDTNLTRIYNKFDEVSGAMMKRLPIWVTVVISVLGSLVTGLAVSVFNHAK